MNDQLVAAAIADGVTVSYGRRTAVDNVTFAVQRGTVYALLGRNGAGKSSLVRCLLGQQKAQRGRIELFGQDAWRDRAELMERVGVVAEEADAPPEMRVEAIAQFCRKLYSRWDEAAFDERLRRFAIPPRARFGELSKGQKKQVTLALALSSSPELVILDDPTLGLDVVARKSLFEEVIAELADRGITVLVTTHDLAGVETIADRVGILVDGRLVLDEELEMLKARFRRIRTAARPVALTNANVATAAIRAWGSGTEAVVTNYDDVTFERFRTGSDVAEVAPMSLEDIFIAVAGEAGAGQ
jgi:ABC-2 type transport system ATP-binding protein